jgi:hypothetical protein
MPAFTICASVPGVDSRRSDGFRSLPTFVVTAPTSVDARAKAVDIIGCDDAKVLVGRLVQAATA